jgi:hypothetical protein
MRRWIAAITGTLLVFACAADAAAVKTADALVTVEITGHGPPVGESDEAVLVFDYRMEHHASDAETVRLLLQVFEITPAEVGDAEYAELFEAGLEEVAAGGIGLQWSVEVEALDASGRVLGTTTLQSACGTRGGEAVEHSGRFFVYEGDPVFHADEVAEVAVDPATLEVLPLVLSSLNEESCSTMLVEARP